MKPYMPVVIDILNEKKSYVILDAPSGGGLPHHSLHFTNDIDGIDLFARKPDGYRKFHKCDLNDGVPDEMDIYDAIVSCEGIEHLGNPILFLETAKDHLNKNGVIIITTPNTWYPTAKLQFFLRGFFPGFPCLTGKIKEGTHMHIMPWSFPQLFLYLKLTGYTDIKLHDVPEKKPKYLYERIIGIPQTIYCKHKYKKSRSQEEKRFWKYAGSDQSVYGRRMVVSAICKDHF